VDQPRSLRSQSDLDRATLRGTSAALAPQGYLLALLAGVLASSVTVQEYGSSGAAGALAAVPLIATLACDLAWA
jgi:hypothetical protein